jgi:hypothetical protein
MNSRMLRGLADINGVFFKRGKEYLNRELNWTYFLQTRERP